MKEHSHTLAYTCLRPASDNTRFPPQIFIVVNIAQNQYPFPASNIHRGEYCTKPMKICSYSVVSKSLGTSLKSLYSLQRNQPEVVGIPKKFLKTLLKIITINYTLSSRSQT